MVDKKQDLKKLYSDAVVQISNYQKKEQLNFRRVELFFSFDIVNSSIYKEENRNGWAGVLTALLRTIKGIIDREMPEAQLWRVLGDEIIFCVPIRSENEISDILDNIFRILYVCIADLQNGSFFDSLSDIFRNNEISEMKNNNSLSLQAAAWLAIIENATNRRLGKYANVFDTYNLTDNQKIFEFLGPDIDAGFRIKKETTKRRMVISFELAALISKQANMREQIKIITYKELKGIWKNHLYPIIWYYNKAIAGCDFQDSFYYDEAGTDELTKSYFIQREDSQGSGMPAYMFGQPHVVLNKIIQDRGLQDKLEEIVKVIEATSKDKRIKEIEDRTLLELHIVAVCCDVENRRIFVARRAKDIHKKFMPEKWEFGCAKAVLDAPIEQKLVSEYRDDFGLEIEVLCDIERNDIQPIPFALYEVSKPEGLHKGIITIAKIKNRYNIDNFKKTKKHDNVRWVTENQINEFQENVTVPDFRNTLKKVFDEWDDLFGRNYNESRI